MPLIKTSSRIWWISIIFPSSGYRKMLGHHTSSGSTGGPEPGPPAPHFWGPRLYSEAQIAPFYTQITEKFSKNFTSLRLAYYFNSQWTYFDQKHKKIIHSWGPRLYSEAQITPFYTQITEKFSKNFASLHSAYYFNSQLTYFDQRHKIIYFWGPRLYSEPELPLLIHK